MQKTPLWQRNYYEHIIRNEADHKRIAEYINNPQHWQEDPLNPQDWVSGYKNPIRYEKN